MSNVAKTNGAVPVQKTTKNAASVKGKSKSAIKAKVGKEKKGITPLRAVLIETVLILLLGSICFAFVFFDYGGVRNSVLTFIQMGEQPYQNQMDALNQLQGQVRDERSQLTVEQEEFAAQQKLMDKQLREIQTREAAIAARTDDLDIQQESLNESGAELAKLVSIYEKMDASTAAKIMEEMGDVDEATRILSRMKVATVADIMSAMSKEFAAKVSIHLAP